MTIRRLTSFIYAAAVICVFISCATHSYDALDAEVRGGQYEKAYADIQKDKKSVYGSDSVRYYLDSGLVAHYAGMHKESTSLLENGDRAIEDAFTKSITQNIASFIANDNTKEYAGEDYENLYVNIFNSLNYYHLGKLEDAMVEIRRMQEKLKNLSVKYNVIEKKLANEDAKAAAKTKGGVNFTNSALARYLSMLFYRARGSYDDARIDCDAIKTAYRDYKNIYNYPLPSSIDGELNIADGQARLNVLAFSGLAPAKVQDTLRIPLYVTNSWIKIALPRMVKRPSDIGAIEIAFDNGKRFRLELLEDIQNVAIETFKKHQGLIEAKSIIRATVKGGATAGFMAAGEDNPTLKLIGVGLQVMTELTERADLRIVRYFPARAYAGGITVEPGEYNFAVSYFGLSGHEIASFKYDNFKISKDSLNLVETFLLK
ncbi:MAG: hypothetical protein LBC77_08825 [Spirochaetaceae bacterium]|nr:hypothetical protein [Spirochaetaceae bacterium]